MPKIDDYFTLSALEEMFNQPSETSNGQASVSGSSHQRRWHAKWPEFIDTIVEWGQAPESSDDDDWISPSVAAVTAAYKLLQRMREANIDVPNAVAPNGEGGISIEYRTGSTTELLEINHQGEIIYFHLENSRIVDKRRIPQ